MKLKKGQTIYLKTIGMRAGGGDKVIKVTIKTVGRKYFSVEEIDGERFHIRDLGHDGGAYVPSYQGYLSEQDIKDEQEKLQLSRTIRGHFSHGPQLLSLESVRAIMNIIVSDTKAKRNG